jgi:hypothetical protein
MFSDMIAAWHNFHVNVPRYGWNSSGAILDVDARGDLVPWQVAARSKYFDSSLETTHVFENQASLHFQGGWPVRSFKRTGHILGMDVVQSQTSDTLTISAHGKGDACAMDSDVLLGLVLQEQPLESVAQNVDVDVFVCEQFLCTLHLSLGVPTPILFGTHPIMFRALQFHTIQLKCSVRATVKTVEAYLPRCVATFAMRSKWLYDFGEKMALQMSGMMSELISGNQVIVDAYCRVPVISDVYPPWLTGVARSRRHIDPFIEELFIKTWHPNRIIEWCFDEDDKSDGKLEVIA